MLWYINLPDNVVKKFEKSEGIFLADSSVDTLVDNLAMELKNLHLIYFFHREIINF